MRRRRRQSSDERAAARERQRRCRRARRLREAGLAPVTLWVPLATVINGWIIRERLDQPGEPPPRELLEDDLAEVVTRWALRWIAHLKELRSHQ